MLLLLISIIMYVTIGVGVFSIVAPRIAWNAARKSRYRSEPDESDKIDGQFGGALIAALWPVSIPATLLYFLIKRAVKATLPILNRENFWDEPKPMQSPVKAYKENKMIKREQQVAQQKDAVTEQRKIINAREAELGFDLTQWDDFPVTNYDRITR